MNRFHSMVSALLLLAAASHPLPAAQARVAITGSFSGAARELVAHFEKTTGKRVEPVFGSSARLFGRIREGEDFAAFLSADGDRPARLERQGHAIAGSRFTYALGRLTLWSKDAERITGGPGVLQDGSFGHLAIANPRSGSYGKAAIDTLKRLELLDRLKPRLLRGSSNAKAFQLVIAGKAELGLIASSQLAESVWNGYGSRWEVPPDLYAPIDQQAVLIRDDPVATAFLDYLQSDAGREIIRTHGYALP